MKVLQPTQFKEAVDPGAKPMLVSVRDWLQETHHDYAARLWRGLVYVSSTSRMRGCHHAINNIRANTAASQMKMPRPTQGVPAAWQLPQRPGLRWRSGRVKSPQHGAVVLHVGTEDALGIWASWSRTGKFRSLRLRFQDCSCVRRSYLMLSHEFYVV